MMNSKLLKLARMVMHLSEVKTNKGELISETVIEVGSEVFIEDANDMLVAAPDGEYVTQDEVTLVVADGKVVEIREKETEEQPMEEPVQEPVEEPLAEEPEQPVDEPAQPDERDKRIAELEAQIDELNQVIVEKDELIGELRKKLEETDSKPAEEQLKSQKPVKSIWKPRF